MATTNESVSGGIKLPGEADDKCCFCVPIRPGLYLIGILMVVWAGNAIFHCFQNLGWGGDYLIYGILYGAAAAPIILGAYFFIRFFMKPEESSAREGTVKACMLVILSSIAVGFIALVQWMLLPGFGFGNFVATCASAGVVALCFFYYAGVAKRFVSQQ